MKKLGFILLMFSGISCAYNRKIRVFAHDELVVTRKYVGNFVNYSNTSPSSLVGPHIMLIKTSQDTVYGNIPIYSRRCKFEQGERLYIKRGYQPNGLSGYWFYQIENEKGHKIRYRVSDLEYSLKI